MGDHSTSKQESMAQLRASLEYATGNRDFEKVQGFRKIGYSLFEYWYERERRIRLHKTDIVVFLEGGFQVRLNSGGWQSVTTKKRINEQIVPLGWNLFQVSGIWYVENRDQGKDSLQPFVDNMFISI